MTKKTRRSAKPTDKAIDDNKAILEEPFISRVYTNKETRRLSNKYDFRRHSGQQTCGTLGRAQYEWTAAIFFAIAKIFGEIVGLSAGEMVGIHDQDISIEHLRFLHEKGYLRSEVLLGNRTVFFPTEELVVNQRIPLRRGLRQF